MDSNSEKQEELLRELEKKFGGMGQNLNTHLEGLLWAKPITYWDYIHTDALLDLQVPRTDMPDEMVFIMYHQINELLFKMILWEIEQVATCEKLGPDFFATKLDRVSRYFDMLSSSFNIMREGMEVEQYMQFRNSLTPASGFQSAQYRMIEFASTELINLIDFRFRDTINRNTSYSYAFENLYWQAAGRDHKSKKKVTMVTYFEKRYRADLIEFMKKYNTLNLWTRFKSLPKKTRTDVALVNAMRKYDHTVNVLWVMSHYNAASAYLESGNTKVEATGGSEWQRYMHPRYQRRIFFPDLWNKKELDNWGITNLEKREILKKV